MVKPFRRHAARPRPLALHVPAARRDQGRPVALAQRQADRPVHHRRRPTSSTRSSPTARPYVFTDLEVALTGFARHDRLLRARRAPDAPRRLLVMPTWRRELLGDRRPAATGARCSTRSGPPTTRVGVARACSSPSELRDLCDGAGWELAFVPHPNMQDYLDSSPLPDSRPAHRFRDIDVQQVLADGGGGGHRLLVARHRGGLHRAPGRLLPVRPRRVLRRRTRRTGRGHWSYEQQGFGPVTDDAAEAVAAIERIAGTTASDPRVRRADAAPFPFRDGRCCERTVAAIRAHREPA